LDTIVLGNKTDLKKYEEHWTSKKTRHIEGNVREISKDANLEINV